MFQIFAEGTDGRCAIMSASPLNADIGENDDTAFGIPENENAETTSTVSFCKNYEVKYNWVDITKDFVSDCAQLELGPTGA